VEIFSAKIRVTPPRAVNRPAKTVSRKGREIDLWYSGKKKDFGGDIQAFSIPAGG
jgi:hypothetical protein